MNAFSDLWIKTAQKIQRTGEFCIPAVRSREGRGLTKSVDKQSEISAATNNRPGSTWSFLKFFQPNLMVLIYAAGQSEDIDRPPPPTPITYFFLSLTFAEIVLDLSRTNHEQNNFISKTLFKVNIVFIVWNVFELKIFGLVFSLNGSTIPKSTCCLTNEAVKKGKRATRLDFFTSVSVGALTMIAYYFGLFNGKDHRTQSASSSISSPTFLFRRFDFLSSINGCCWLTVNVGHCRDRPCIWTDVYNHTPLRMCLGASVHLM